MFECLCLAGLMFANLWGFGEARQINKSETGGEAVGTAQGALIGPNAATPIPIQPWIATPIEERNAQKDPRTLILPPLKVGERATCDEAPDRQEILRALPRMDRGVPFHCEIWRDDLEFTVEKLVDRIDPPRFFPLIGPAQLHHCHWKCTVYFTETIEAAYPFPFRAKKRRAEVVYIDKDRFHLCAAQAPAIPEWCPGGHSNGKPAVKNTSEAKQPQQVQIDGIVACVHPDALEKFPLKLFHDMGDPNVRKVRCEVLSDVKPLHDFLSTMSADGHAKVLAEPRVMTLNGQTAQFISGGDYPIPTIDASGVRGVNFTPFGTKLKMVPTVQADGKIHLHVHAEFSAVDPRPVSPRASASPADVVPGITTQNAEVGAQMKPGQSIVLGGLMHDETVVTRHRVPFWGSLPLLDRLFTQIGYHQEKRDLVIVLTPRLVNAYGGAEASHAPPAGLPPFPTVAAKAEHRVAPADILHVEAERLVPKGPYRLQPRDVLLVEIADGYSWQNLRGDFVIAADGCINLGQIYGTIKVAGLTVEEAHGAIRKGLAPIMKDGFRVRTLLVEARGICQVRCEHLVRPDGTISLGTYGAVHVQGMTLGEVKRAVENHLSNYTVDPRVCVKMSEACKPMPEVRVTYEYPANGRTPTSQVEIVPVAASSQPMCPVAAPTPLKVADIVALTRAGATDDIILRHMEQTNSAFRLSTPDLLFLLESGVSPHVIRAMQERRGAMPGRPVHVEPQGPLLDPGIRFRY